jgi:hypothetical protein
VLPLTVLGHWVMRQRHQQVPGLLLQLPLAPWVLLLLGLLGHLEQLVLLVLWLPLPVMLLLLPVLLLLLPLLLVTACQLLRLLLLTWA